ncbi:hypothetical protein CCUS01_05511 [Colletotrichum cuscutae]|uniref:Uncharacterized protein n=1 Tax=Colletotrichum cuscutae TaxID=1209917 RepID=A0AAI9Y532_9PEZI|nr:hypothetical protein CCUS01_05511 [Colletotrichum cuscutae]
MAPSTSKELPDVEIDLLRTEIWAQPKDASLLSVTEQIILNNLEVMARQNTLILQLLMKNDQETSQAKKAKSTSKSKRRRLDSSENEEESDDNEDQAATKVLHQRFSEKMLGRYRKFIRKTGHTPYVKKGKTITMAKNAREFREALANGVESDNDSDESFTDEEVRHLKKKIPGKLNDEEKYFRVWDQFFTAHPRPESPYVDEGIWEPFGLLVGIAKRNITNEEFSSWALDKFCPPCEDVLLQLLTLRHEHTRISRHFPIRAEHDPSILVNNDTHLTVLRSRPSNPIETTFVAPLWPSLPAIALDTDTNILNVFPPSGLCEPGLPESSGSGNVANLNTGWNPAIGNIADIRDPGAIPPSDTSRLTGMDGFVDLDDGSRQEGYQE